MKKSTFLSAFMLFLTSIFAQQAFAQPANDACASATVITSNATCVTMDGTVNGATATPGLAKGICDAFSTPSMEDVWYSFTAQYASNTIQVRLRGGSNLDAVLILYSGTCGSLTELDCDDTSGVGDATISYSNFVVGETYLFRIYDYGSAAPPNGDFTICVIHSASGANVDLEYQDHITLDGVSGNGSGDSDRLGEPGETISLAVNLVNNGTTSAHNVNGTLTCSDPDITFTTNTGTWATIAPGASESTNDFIFAIAGSAIEKDVIMNLTVDTDEGTFTDSFLFHIYDGNVSVHKNDQLIRDGNGGGTGNSNGQLDPGENISLEIKLHNGGTSIAHNVHAVLNTTDADITMGNNTVNIGGDVAAGSDAWAQSFTFDVAGSCLEKDIVFTLTISSDEGSWIDQFILHVNDAAAINNIAKDEIKIYPNPATQYINIIAQNNDVEIQQVEILNLNGQLMMKEENVERMNISALRSGLYIIRITDINERIGYFKFIKQ